MLFNFALDPVDEVIPWGEPPNLSLHWFALTQGQYFIDVGTDQLLRYSDECQKKLAARNPHCRQTAYLDYYVTRFHQDILEIAPRIIEPVPDALAEYARSAREPPWRTQANSWLESQCDNDDEAFDRQYTAVNWLSGRTLDTSYLSKGPNIWFWRLHDTVFIEWDNRRTMLEEVRAWSAQRGSASILAESFVSELDAFHSRFMQEMQNRVEAVFRNPSIVKAAIDCDALQEDQACWNAPIEQFLRRVDGTDWESVQNAIRHIETCR